ncbi:hypothetical protein [Sphingomonas sp. 2SG]|uniref:hypothetical protein n=1 Tax=Sphingomonas sp. 2SG TaxID=2502201 RepID=UPI0010F7E0DA|nr:hypothetical protein [Sphingomonas sp. 2SG]
MLALDARDSGLLDFPHMLSRAIAETVRTEAAYGRPIRNREAFHGRMARRLAEQRQRCRLSIEDDTVLLAGSIGEGAGVSQWRGGTVLHLVDPLPEVVVAAMVGRPIADVVGVELFRRHRAEYVIVSACQDRSGCTIALRTPVLRTRSRTGRGPGADWTAALR